MPVFFTRPSMCDRHVCVGGARAAHARQVHGEGRHLQLWRGPVGNCYGRRTKARPSARHRVRPSYHSIHCCYPPSVPITYPHLVQFIFACISKTLTRTSFPTPNPEWLLNPRQKQRVRRFGIVPAIEGIKVCPMTSIESCSSWQRRFTGVCLTMQESALITGQRHCVDRSIPGILRY
jgi:hypothetical protein